MKTNLEFKLEYMISERLVKFPVIIVAAGSASRMKGIDKLSAEIKGMPVLARTISVFDSCDSISEIIIVTRTDKVSEYEDYKAKFGFSKEYSVVIGGESREDSVLNGINALKENYDKVLIHDAARPLISQDVIRSVCEALVSNDSVSCGVKVKDTIKTINEDMMVVNTLNRNALISIQTPQGVSVSLFKESASKNTLSQFTDDTSVVEALGAKTRIVEGDYRNIKITTPEDLKLAEMFLED